MTTLCLCDYVEPRSGCEPKPAIPGDPVIPCPLLPAIAAAAPGPTPASIPSNGPRLLLTHVAVLLLGGCGAVTAGPGAGPAHGGSAPVLSRAMDRDEAPVVAATESSAADPRPTAAAMTQVRMDHQAVATRIALANFVDEIDAATRRAAIDQNSCRALYGPARVDCVASVDATLVRQQRGANSRRDAALSVASDAR